MITTVVLIGTVLNAGTPCPKVRADNGRVVTATGLPNTIQSGERVKLSGVMRFSFSCQAEVLAVQSADKATD